MGVRGQPRRDSPFLAENDVLITRADIEAAAARIAPHVSRTELRRSSWLSRELDADVYLKIETTQPTRSYKIRGALNAMLRLAGQSDVPPALVTASAGNHGQALAHAARLFRIPLTVYVPEQAPAVKLQAMEGAGASLVLCADYDAAERRAKEHGTRGLAEYVSPYAHPDVIAGAGTIALEILEEDPSIDAIVAPIGGGGLISGLAIAAGGPAQVFGVEAEASTPFKTSLAAGRIVPVDVQPTLADGLAGNLDPDSITFEIVRQRVARLTSVTESEIRDAVSSLLANEGITVEGACAVGVAGLRSKRLDLKGRIAVVLTGANIDPEKLQQVLDSRS